MKFKSMRSRAAVFALTQAWHCFSPSMSLHQATFPKFLDLSFVCLCAHNKQTEVSGGSMKRSVSTVADQRANGLWQEEKSPERVYRPRHKSYKAAGQWNISVVVVVFIQQECKHGSALSKIQGGCAFANVATINMPPHSFDFTWRCLSDVFLSSVSLRALAAGWQGAWSIQGALSPALSRWVSL